MYWTRTTEKKAKLGSAFLNVFSSSKKDVNGPAGDESKQPAEAPVVEKPQIEMENLKGRCNRMACACVVRMHAGVQC